MKVTKCIIPESKVGGSPIEGDVYGYSGWTKEKGIVGFRNPSSEQQTYKIALDSLLGLKDKEQKYYRKIVYPYGASEDGPYKYGDKISIKLQSYDAYIWKFDASSDREAPTIKQVKSEREDQIKIIFSERIEKTSAENIKNYELNPAEDVKAGGGL